MAIDLVKYNGIYLATRLRESTIPWFRAFSDTVAPDILGVFEDIESRSEVIAEAEFERLANRATGESADGDLSIEAESAFDVGVAFFSLMTDFKQATTNLLAVGLFHLLEQQLSDLTTDGLFNGMPRVRDCKISEIEHWFRTQLDVDLSAFQHWDVINREMRYVANTVKHADGSSARALRKVRPDYFADPLLAGHSDQSTTWTTVAQSPIRGPLAGDGFYLPADALNRYCTMIIEYLQSLSAYFDELGQSTTVDIRSC